MTKIHKLKRPLGRSYTVHGDDVFAVKSALTDLGFLPTSEEGYTPYPDEALFRAIERFQAGNDLKIDGVIKPGGETERALAARSHQYICSACGVFHGGVYSPKLCSDCFGKLS